MVTRPALWRCPECGREFANRRQSHSCGRYTLAHHFRGKPPAIRRLSDAVVGIIQALGPVRILPEKTRIAFQVRMSFAQVTPRRGWLDGHVVPARRLEQPRFTKVPTSYPRNHLHALGLRKLSEVAAESRSWMAEAYLVGDQRHLSRREKLE